FKPAADIVVVNLGTNDNAGGVATSTFKSAVKSFTQTIRSYNPDAKVIWVTGMKGTVYQTEMTAAVSELGGATSGYYFLELPYGISAGGHPNADEHTAAAEVLAKFLKANCLPEDYATVAAASTLQAKINEAQAAPFTSAALTEAVEAAQMELAIGTTDEFRLGSRVDAIEAALNGETAGASLMPNAKYSTYDTETNGGYDHVVVPTYNADGSVKLVKSGTTSYWPRVDTKIGYAWNVKAAPYLRVELSGTAEWNAAVIYEDASGAEHNVAMTTYGNGGADYQATSTRQVVSVDLGSVVYDKGYANADDVVRVKYIRFYVVGTNGVYVNLYDCSFTESNGTTWAGASDAASYISSANAVYVRESGATLSGAIPSGANVFVKSGVENLTLDNVTMSGAAMAFTVKSNVTVKLVGTSTVTATTQFSGGTPTYIGTGVLMNGSTVVMRKGDVVTDSKNRVDSTNIRAMMNHCAGISTLSDAKVKIADTKGNGLLDTRDVRRYLDTVVV
ncbi:MAG: hypothetical protein IJC52_03045, partial [Clostridia bacterium]|nr:hypothetical protein [Clostridia bacterium]